MIKKLHHAISRVSVFFSYMGTAGLLYHFYLVGISFLH